MARSYNFEHFTAARPAVSPWKRASSHEKQVMTRAPLPLHYGHAHSSTGMIYQQHREDYLLQEAMRIPEPPRERPVEEVAPAMEAREETRQDPRPDLFGREGIQDLGQRAMESVRRAAREAARGQALRGVRRLADDAVSGTLRVVREASDRVSRLASDLSEQTTKVRPSR